MAGVALGVAYVWRMHGVGVWCAMACIGVCGYGVQACVGTVCRRVWVRVYVDTLTW